MTTVQEYGAKKMRRILLGKETVRGTAVLPTTIWRGEGTLQDDAAYTTPPEDIGAFMNAIRTYASFKGGTLNLTPVPATFEQLPHILEMAIKKVASGVQDGSGSGYIYTYPLPVAAAQTVGTYSIEAGDNAVSEQAAYAYCENFKLSGKSNQAITMAATLKTRAVASQSLTATTISFDDSKHILDSGNGLAGFTAGMRVKVNGTANNNGVFTIAVSAAGQLTTTEDTTTEAAGGSVTIDRYFTSVTLPAVQELIFNASKLYIDDVSDDFGDTQITGTFWGFDLDYTSGMQGVSTGEGRADMDFGVLLGMAASGTLKLSFLMDSVWARQEKAKARAHTPRKFRIVCEGAALGTAGTTYSKKTCIIDFEGIYTKMNPPSEDNGKDVLVAEASLGIADPTDSAGQVIVVNELSALP